MAKTKWFNAQRNPPWESGEYEVRNAIPIHPNAMHCLKSANSRWWDAEVRIWRVSPSGPASIMGTHRTHEWRGREANDDPEPLSKHCLQRGQ